MSPAILPNILHSLIQLFPPKSIQHPNPIPILILPILPNLNLQQQFPTKKSVIEYNSHPILTLHILNHFNHPLIKFSKILQSRFPESSKHLKLNLAKNSGQDMAYIRKLVS